MLLLLFCWLLVGLLVGALANIARLGPVGWVRGRYFVGVLTAWLGGWLGMVVFGLLFATATAIWIAVLGVVLLPLAITWCRARMG